MKRIFFLILFLSSAVFAYVDSDMDGVEDRDDKCPQTSLSDLVDLDGCVIQKTDNNLHYDLLLGTELSSLNNSSQVPSDTLNTYVQANMYLDRWRLELAGSYYISRSSDASQSGSNDTFVNIFYGTTPSEKLRVEIGAGAILPTYVSGYDNEATDYSALINFQYNINPNFYLFGSDTYTWVEDKNIATIHYQNTNSFQIGAGVKPTQNLNLNLWYSEGQSIYTDVEAIASLGIGAKISLNPHWSVGSAYMYGLSDSASTHTFSVELGYSF